MWTGWIQVIGNAAQAFVEALEGAGIPVTGGVTATDPALEITAVGQKTTGASAAVATGMTGEGWLTILNTSTTDGAYLGIGTVDSGDFLLPAGGNASVTWHVADVTTVHCFGTGAVLSWSFLQVPS